MNKDLHDIDNLFKQSIDGHLEEVPAEVWQNIDHGLDKRQAAFYKRRYFTVRAAAILLLLVGGVTIAAILRYHSVEKQAGKEIGTAKSSHQLKMTRQGPGEPGKQYTVEEQQSTAQEHLPADKTPANKIIVKNDSQGQIESSENSTYTAEKNGEVKVGARKSTSSGQKDDVRMKPIGGVPAYEVVQRNEVKRIQQTGREDKGVKQGALNELVRTSHVDTRAINVNEFRINNMLPEVHAGSNSVVPVFNNVASLPIAEKSRNSLGSWSVSPNYAQNINLNRLKDDDHFRDPRNNSREARRTEQETKSFSIGFGVQKSLAGNFVLQSGVQYFSSQTTITPKMIFAEPDARGEVRYRFNCSSGDSYIPSKSGVQPAIGDSIKTNSSESELSYLQVPLLASYRISVGKLSILPSAGIQTNFLLNSKLKSSLVQPSGDEEVTSSISGLRSMYFSGILQPQLNYKFSDRISFDLTPGINFSLTPINNETAVKTYQNMFSLGAGLRIKL
ncbi:MAG: outer membrane beta-barrel protein [Flavisolibacter sp.]